MRVEKDGALVAPLPNPVDDRDYDSEVHLHSDSEDDEANAADDSNETGPPVISVPMTVVAPTTASTAPLDTSLVLQETSGNVSRKRKIDCLRYYTCDQCDEEYSIDENNTKACVYHPGKHPLVLAEAKKSLQPGHSHADMQ